MSGKEVAPRLAAANSDYINITVKNQDRKEDSGEEVMYFRIKSNTLLKKVMDAYHAKINEKKNTYVFLYEGTKIREKHTPEKLGMENGDEIDAMTYMHGGGRSSVGGTTQVGYQELGH